MEKQNWRCIKLVAGMGELDGGPHGGFLPIRLNDIFWVFLKQQCIRLVCETLTVFLYTIYQQNRYIFFFLTMYFVIRSQFAFTRNLLNCNSDFMK